MICQATTTLSTGEAVQCIRASDHGGYHCSANNVLYWKPEEDATHTTDPSLDSGRSLRDSIEAYRFELQTQSADQVRRAEVVHTLGMLLEGCE